MTTRKTPKPAPSIAPWIFVALGAVVLFLGLLGLMLFQAERLVGLGLAGPMWFVLLMVLGSLVAVVLFAVFKSQAIYKGQVLNGELRLAGPGVLVFAILLIGLWWWAKLSAGPFDLTVLLQGAPGSAQARPLRGRGQLLLDLGSDQRTEAVGEKGEVRFMALPADQRGKTVGVLLQGADQYELVEPNVTLSAEAARVTVRARLLSVHGEVHDPRGQAVGGAEVRLAEQKVEAGGDGRFTLRLPADLPEGERDISVSAPGYRTWRGQVVPGGGTLQVVLEKTR